MKGEEFEYLRNGILSNMTLGQQERAKVCSTTK